MKTLVNISVPAIQKEMDMLIPDFLSVGEVTGQVVRAVREEYGEVYQSSGEEVLCSKERNVILDTDFSLKENRVANGDTLILI